MPLKLICYTTTQQLYRTPKVCDILHTLIIIIILHFSPPADKALVQCGHSNPHAQSNNQRETENRVWLVYILPDDFPNA